MNYYFAPMEGLTDSIYRKLHHRFFPGIDRYYTPFLSPTVHRKLTAKEERELPPADSLDFCVVPQMLTKNAADFLWLAQEIHDRGYSQVNQPGLPLRHGSGQREGKRNAGRCRYPGCLSERDFRCRPPARLH